MGGTRSDIFFGVADELALPTQVSSDLWKSLALGSGHISVVQDNGSLWTAGGITDLETNTLYNPELARSEQTDTKVAQVGTKSSWLKTWVGKDETFALDEDSQIWVAGGENSENSFALLGLGESVREVSQLTPLQAIPRELTGTGDADNDELLDYADKDDDNDGVFDRYDAFRTDPAESIDTDLDGIGNNTDSDDDGDNVTDTDDAFLLDAAESKDTDNDGVGNNTDSDDDNDGVDDNNDVFPLDSSRSANLVTPTNNSDSGGGGTINYLLIIMLLSSLRLFGRAKQ